MKKLTKAIIVIIGLIVISIITVFVLLHLYCAADPIEYLFYATILSGLIYLIASLITF